MDTQKTTGGGGIVSPGHLIAALEELARKRGELTAAIVTLASVAGVDPAPYLGGDPSAIARAVAFVGAAAPPPKVEAPPRPQRPASPATKGTGRAHKVSNGAGALSATAASVLAGVQKAAGPLSPADLGRKLGIDGSLASYHLRNLAKQGLVVIKGKGRGQRAQEA